MLSKLLSPFVRNDLTWKLLNPLAKVGLNLAHLRAKVTYKPSPPAYQSMFAAKRVLNGPFKGMKYPSFEAVGSTFYPKLMGSYEKEIQGIIEHFCTHPYSEIIDVGCAEGYYAVGLGMRSKATIFAYDTEQKARDLCSEMAKLNGVEVTVRAFCSADELGSFKFSGHGLVFCDCESYEKELFTEKSLRNLTGCDILVEIHDFMDITISSTLFPLLSATHDVQVIKSIDDIEKAKTYAYPQTDNLDLLTKKELFAERRPAIMEWYYCTPKKN